MAAYLLFQSKQFVDLKLILIDTTERLEMDVHKFCLAIKSPFFEKLFTKLKESTQSVIELNVSDVHSMYDTIMTMYDHVSNHGMYEPWRRCLGELFQRDFLGMPIDTKSLRNLNMNAEDFAEAFEMIRVLPETSDVVEFVHRNIPTRDELIDLSILPQTLANAVMKFNCCDVLINPTFNMDGLDVYDLKTCKLIETIPDTIEYDESTTIIIGHLIVTVTKINLAIYNMNTKQTSIIEKILGSSPKFMLIDKDVYILDGIKLWMISCESDGLYRTVIDFYTFDQGYKWAQSVCGGKYIGLVDDVTMTIWDLKTKCVVNKFKFRSYMKERFCTMNYGTSMFVVDDVAHKITVFDLLKGESTRECTYEKSVKAICISPDDKYLYVYTRGIILKICTIEYLTTIIKIEKYIPSAMTMTSEYLVLHCDSMWGIESQSVIFNVDGSYHGKIRDEAYGTATIEKRQLMCL